MGSAGLGVRAVLQAIYLLILSRWLGADGYGLLAGSVAFVVLCAPLASWGSSLLVLRHIARDRRSSRAMWATALSQTVFVGGLLALCVLAGSTLLGQRLPMVPMLMLAVSELLLLPISWAATAHCQALDRGAASAFAMCLSPVIRVGAVGLAIASGLSGTPEVAIAAHFSGSVVAAAAALALVVRIDGWPEWKARLPLCESLRAGTPYAAGNVAGNAYQEIDKVLMLQMLGAGVVGPYTVAFRVTSIFVMPVSALISASLPRLVSRAGSPEGAQTYRAVLMSGVGYGALVGVFIFGVAPWLPRIFGADYALASHYLGLLAVWPALFATRQCLATQLTSNNRQALRSWIEIGGVGVVAMLNLLLLPRIGAMAAVIALLISEILVIVTMVSLGRRGSRKREPQLRRR